MQQETLKTFVFTTIAICLIFLNACKPASIKESKTKIAMVSILPQKQIFEQIAGNRFEVQVLLPPGANHETFEPSPRDMEKTSNATVYAAIGCLDFENALLPRMISTNPNLKVIYTNKNIDLLGGHIHQHNGYTHQTVDPHIWMSASCLKQQAENICQTLCAIDSTNALFYRQNLEQFKSQADSIHQIIKTKLQNLQVHYFMIYHPALAYFARDYGLNQICIEHEGKEPSPAHVRQLIDLAREKEIKTIFISKEFDTKNAETIAKEIGARIVEFDPMHANWQQNLLKFSELIAQ